MNFNSIEFLIFFPIVMLLNFVVPTKFRIIPLLAMSYYFYMSWNPELVFLILFTTVVSYLSGLVIEKTESVAKRKVWLAISIVASLAVLFFFKYYNFLAGGVSSIFSLFGGKADFTIEGLVLPVGISFYTFQTLSYSIDVYRKNIPAERNFLYYALFVSFFPQLVAGPIERPENLLPQLKVEHKLNISDLSIGAKRAISGFFKKVVVADIAGTYVNGVFNNPDSATGAAVVLASMLFAVQIYCDFSGYTDIAIGCGRMMGYRLMQNFDRPYSATNIKDFWSRWHISLTSWFKDYLYIPLGGNRKGKARMYVNLFIVFLVSGLWHGADMTFVIWGVLHGIYRVVGAVTAKKRDGIYGKMGLDINSKPVLFFRRIITFLLVCFAWIFFRANNTQELVVLLSKLFTDFGAMSVLSDMGFTLSSVLILVLSIVLLSMIDRRYTYGNYDSVTGEKIGVDAATLLVWAIIFAWILILGGDATSSIASGGASAFIYFQF
ncbi:MAG: MBOAT family protein [Ruminococcaceae bacterium]|nr:MBOAT family protein [Oscillospiraceae bacterium]